jgi:hypothetical protein
MKEIKINASKILLLMLLFIQCKEEKATFFAAHQIKKDDFLILKDTFFYYKDEKRIGYNMEFIYYKQGREASFFWAPVSGLYGKIFMQNNQILCIPHLGNKPYVLFDFNLKKGEEKAIEWSVNELIFIVDCTYMGKIGKKYQLTLDCLDYDNAQQDTVYTFRFEDFGCLTETSDLVMQVSKQRGILSYGFLVDKECYSSFEIPCYPKATRPLRACQ